eukprot:428155_1
MSNEMRYNLIGAEKILQNLTSSVMKQLLLTKYILNMNCIIFGINNKKIVVNVLLNELYEQWIALSDINGKQPKIKTLDGTIATLAGITVGDLETLNNIHSINDCLQDTEINTPSNTLNEMTEAKSNNEIPNISKALEIERTPCLSTANLLKCDGNLYCLEFENNKLMFDYLLIRKQKINDIVLNVNVSDDIELVNEIKESNVSFSVTNLKGYRIIDRLIKECDFGQLCDTTNSFKEIGMKRSSLIDSGPSLNGIKLERDVVITFSSNITSLLLSNKVLIVSMVNMILIIGVITVVFLNNLNENTLKYDLICVQ